MKKKLFLISALLWSGTTLNSQVVFSENFDATSTIPSGWKMYDEDKLIPNPGHSVTFNAPWRFLKAQKGYGNSAGSTSYYSPPGKANDWLVSPPIIIPSVGDCYLQFEIKALNSELPDGYEVYISTTGNTVSDFIGAPVDSLTKAPSSFTTRTVNLSSYLGKTIYIAFRNNSNDKYILLLDNVVVSELKPNRVMLTQTSLNRYSLVSTNNTLSLEVKNEGNNAIKNLTVDWNDGVSHSQVITCDISPGNKAVIQHPTPVNYSIVVEKSINVSINLVNGEVDSGTSTNNGNAKINTLSSIPLKRVVFEEGTGTWCGFCPRGAVAMEYMQKKYPEFIGIAVHNQDPMTVTAYDAGTSATLTGYPGANVDRSILGLGVTSEIFENSYLQRSVLATPASIDGTITHTGATVTINASATFKTVFSNAKFRLAAAIVEDSIIGDSDDYDQANYFSGSPTPLIDVNGLNYSILPNPIPHNTPLYNGEIYKYNHVARAILGGYKGQINTVPSTITEGLTASYSFNYNVPSGSKLENMHVVIMLIDQESGEIVNAIEKDITSLGVNTIPVSDINFVVSPNPAKDKLSVSFEAKSQNYFVSITDVMGRTITSNAYSNLSGNQNIELSLDGCANGNYIITVATDKESFNKHVVIQK